MSCHRVALRLGINPTMLGVAPSIRFSIQTTSQAPADRPHLVRVLLPLARQKGLERATRSSSPFMKVDSTSEALMLVTDPGALSWVTKDIGRCHSRSARR